MDEELKKILKYLRLGGLLAEWDELLAKARRGRFSHERLLRHVLEAEYRVKMENARLLRRKRAHIPEILEIETFPFARQPKLNRKQIMSLYDGFDYMTKQQNIVWLGPTGCGKSGMATGFLLQALDRGYRGYFITFPELLAELYASLADRSEEKALRKYARYDCLVIDEVGYVEIEPAQVGLFFTLMQKRHKTRTTLITSNLGFSEWGSFLKNNHLTGALPLPDAHLLDRVSQYLTQRRGLALSLIKPLMESGNLYADSRGNVVFLLVAGKAQRPVGAELRGTGPRVWRGMAPGTRKDLGYFWIGEQGSREIVLCESAIDAMSCFQIHPQRICISTSGVRADPPWLDGLLARGYDIFCGFDADGPGDAAATRMRALHPAVRHLRPPAHDWNDVLTSSR